MSDIKSVREIINTLPFNKEFGYEIFENLDISTISMQKSVHRSPHLIAQTKRGKFYRKLIPEASDSFLLTNAKPYEYYDNEKVALYDPKRFNSKEIWQSSKPSYQKITTIIRRTLSAMDKEDIYELCLMFGIQRVKMELILMYKEMYKDGFINLNGLELKLNGRYDRDASYKILRGYIDDISSKKSTN
ncbi:MAG: hypothetical protein M0Q24_08585 [Sulfurimonas sp.]|uniref:hypothetical protein n=1 Tax=Sulfurimonas sp. TaxID=2022749 RepID=UPI0025EC6D06|nr:hypothetical protein [Sulfurimonas sp.]MCK9492135.1 hypothetical protein [Sulfurimonas sp.]